MNANNRAMVGSCGGDGAGLLWPSTCPNPYYATFGAYGWPNPYWPFQGAFYGWPSYLPMGYPPGPSQSQQNIEVDVSSVNLRPPSDQVSNPPSGGAVGACGFAPVPQIVMGPGGRVMYASNGARVSGASVGSCGGGTAFFPRYIYPMVPRMGGLVAGTGNGNGNGNGRGKMKAGAAVGFDMAMDFAPGWSLRIQPYKASGNVVLSMTLETPYGPVDAVGKMSEASFNAMMASGKARLGPRIQKWLQGMMQKYGAMAVPPSQVPAGPEVPAVDMMDVSPSAYSADGAAVGQWMDDADAGDSSTEDWSSTDWPSYPIYYPPRLRRRRPRWLRRYWQWWSPYGWYDPYAYDGYYYDYNPYYPGYYPNGPYWLNGKWVFGPPQNQPVQYSVNGQPVSGSGQGAATAGAAVGATSMLDVYMDSMGGRWTMTSATLSSGGTVWTGASFDYNGGVKTVYTASTRDGVVKQIEDALRFGMLTPLLQNGRPYGQGFPTAYSVNGVPVTGAPSAAPSPSPAPSGGMGPVSAVGPGGLAARGAAIGQYGYGYGYGGYPTYGNYPNYPTMLGPLQTYTDQRGNAWTVVVEKFLFGGGVLTYWVARTDAYGGVVFTAPSRDELVRVIETVASRSGIYYDVYPWPYWRNGQWRAYGQFQPVLYSVNGQPVSVPTGGRAGGGRR